MGAGGWCFIPCLLIGCCSICKGQRKIHVLLLWIHCTFLTSIYNHFSEGVSFSLFCQCTNFFLSVLIHTMASGSKSVGSLDARPKQSLPAIIYSNEGEYNLCIVCFLLFLQHFFLHNYNAEIFLDKPSRPISLFQLEIIINADNRRELLHNVEICQLFKSSKWSCMSVIAEKRGQMRCDIWVNIS